MINKFLKHGVFKVTVKGEQKSYIIEATVDPRVYGEVKPNLEKKAEAEAEGKQYVFNVKRGQWQKADIQTIYLKTDDGLVDEWFTFEIFPKAKRMSLGEAVAWMEKEWSGKVERNVRRNSEADPRYIFSGTSHGEPFGLKFFTGRELVRFVQDNMRQRA